MAKKNVRQSQSQPSEKVSQKVWTIRELNAYHEKKLEESKHIMVENKEVPAFEYAINASGGELLISDLESKDKNPDSDQVIVLAPGEIIYFNGYFAVPVINRNKRHLVNSMKIKGMLGIGDEKLYSLLNIESPDIEFPIPLKTENLVTKIKSKNLQGNPIELPINEFDIALQKDIEKEKVYNEKISRRAGMGDNSERVTREEFDKRLS